MKKYNIPNEVILSSTSKIVTDLCELPKVGAGHDGYVIKYNEDLVLKILKYDIILREDKNLMTYSKAVKFMKKLNLKRFTQPIDTLFDNKGIFVGYMMKYVKDITNDKNLPSYREPGDFRCGDLLESCEDLKDDFPQMTSKDIIAKDINSGSYIFDYDFIHICDMDKFYFGNGAKDINKCILNFIIAKFLYLEMKKCGNLSNDDIKKLNHWVKKMTNSNTFLNDLNHEIGNDYGETISSYLGEKVKTLLK